MRLGPALLHYVGQLVGQQLLSSRATGVVISLPEKDVLAGGESHRTHGVVEGVGLGVVMDFYPAEIRAKGALH